MAGKTSRRTREQVLDDMIPLEYLRKYERQQAEITTN